MEQKKKSCCDSEELLHGEEAKKTAGNNQWTNNNLKYYPDERDRQDGPGGNGCRVGLDADCTCRGCPGPVPAPDLTSRCPGCQGRCFDDLDPGATAADPSPDGFQVHFMRSWNDDFRQNGSSRRKGRISLIV